MIRYPREQQMFEVIRASAPLAGLQPSPQQAQILAKACAKAAALPPTELGRPTRPRPELTAADWQLLALVAQGFSNTELAWRLKVSHGAARQRVSSLLRRLDVENRVQAVALGYELGLLPIVGASGAAR